MSRLETAVKRAMYLLGGKDYSKKELIEKLEANYDSETAAAAAEKMCEYGYIDDRRYAAKLASQYINVRKYGRSRAAMMMKQKGLEEETVREALESFSENDLISEVAEILRKKYPDRLFLPGLDGKKEMQKITAALARRGYSYPEIKSALYILKDEIDNEEE